ncbi:hypothetical protein C0J52_00084 [Blattella germanica]|nr:hypothetical protein C0J52_00084 [Blattella germanica]
MSVKMWRYFQWFAYVVYVGAQSYRDSRLVVTDYIELGRIEEAKNASKVISRDLYTSVVTSYSGFFRVTHEQNRHLYFWYFPCEYRNETKPLVLWLEGDPGKSSILGVFSGVGPYTLNAAETAVIYNPNTWTKEFNVLFVDSPVGAGAFLAELRWFSFSESRSIGSVSSIRDLAKHLLKALRQFYIMFPELRSQPFFIAGRRFAGKPDTVEPIRGRLLPHAEGLRPEAVRTAPGSRLPRPDGGGVSANEHDQPGINRRRLPREFRHRLLYLNALYYPQFPSI